MARALTVACFLLAALLGDAVTCAAAISAGPFAAGSGLGPNPPQATNPVIAIVVTPASDAASSCGNSTPPVGKFTGCVPSFYNDWLAMSGTRVVPMSIEWPEAKKVALLSQVNGVLFPGGGLTNTRWNEYTGNASQILDYAVRTPGFFVWGTCQGFQVLTTLIAKSNSILTCDYVGTYPSMLPLDFTANMPTSVMYGQAAQEAGIVDDLATKNTTLNLHHCGIAPANFRPAMTNDLKVLSTNVDANNKPFLSSWEWITSGGMNVMATQYHPERPPYEFTSDVIAHDPATIAGSQYLSRLVHKRLQMNKNAFSDPSAVNAMTFDNFPLVNDGWGYKTYWVNV